MTYLSKICNLREDQDAFFPTKSITTQYTNLANLFDWKSDKVSTIWSLISKKLMKSKKSRNFVSISFSKKASRSLMMQLTSRIFQNFQDTNNYHRIFCSDFLDKWVFRRTRWLETVFQNVPLLSKQDVFQNGFAEFIEFSDKTWLEFSQNVFIEFSD